MGANQYSLSTPAFCDDSIYITTLNWYSYTSGIYCIDAESGDMTWHVPLSGPTFYTSPAVADDKIYISTEEGFLYCLDTTHGGLIWSYQLDYDTMCSPAIADERLYIADYYGNIYAFEDELKIAKISGGFLNVKAEIKNAGESDFTNVSWSISVAGGMLGMVNRTASDTIQTLEAGSSRIVRALPVFGIGKIHVTVTATMPGLNVIKKTKDGFALGPIVVMLPDS